LADANKLTPNFDWKNFFALVGAPQTNEIIVATPDFFKELSKMLKDEKLENWKSYIQWHFIASYAPNLSDDFVNENFSFFDQALRGSKELKPRWKRVSETADASLGDALGQLYVKKAFSPEAKVKANEMVNNLRAAFGERIKNLDWMSAETKEQALKKLASMRQKIGYTDKWNTYDGLDINRESFVLNILSSNEYEYKRDINKIGKEVDREEWGMTPATVNAYYNPLNNEIVFPAGILQPPFFNANADDAINYGGIGGVIGHEISHGFDDSGCKYDAEGNMKNWWTDEDKAKFDSKTAELVKQFDAFKVLDTVSVNGQLTLGENIADLGGLAVAYDAFKMELSKTGKNQPIDGLTPEQRFFLGWAQVWRIKMRDEAMLERIKTDSHAPGHLRAYAPLTHLMPFYEAFDAKEGDAMYKKPEERIVIW
jgi:putative endopeptidase